MTRTNAKKFISKGLGGQNVGTVLQMADEAITQGFEDWQAAKNWYFMLKDTAAGFLVTGVSWTGVVSSINAPVTGAFDGINIFSTISGAGIQNGTTITAFTRNTDGTIASITLSLPTTGTQTGITVTIGGEIPLVCGQQEYNLFPDFLAPYHSRMLSKRLPLDYIQYRYWNQKIVDHTIQGLPVAYTVYNPVSAETQNFGVYRMRLFRIPNGIAGTQYDTITQQYYRKFNFASDPLDIPDRYLMKFLNYCQWLFLAKKDAVNERLPQMEKIAMSSLQSAMTDDEELAEEEEQTRLVSQMEAGLIPRPLWSNSQFSLFYGEI